MATILIVEDDEDILEAMKIVLESAGHVVIGTTIPEDAYQQANRIKPRMIFLDLFLSGSNGADVIVKLKQGEETKGIPIIITSAHPLAKRTAKEIGADAFLAKPFSIDNLVSIAEKYSGNSDI